MMDTKKSNKPAKTRKQAAEEVASVEEMTKQNNERINARLSALLSKHCPKVPLDAPIPPNIAAQQTLLVMAAAIVPLARRRLRLDMTKPVEEYTEEDAALLRRLDRNGRLLVRLVVFGLMRRGEVTPVPDKSGKVSILTPKNISQTLRGAVKDVAAEDAAN